MTFTSLTFLIFFPLVFLIHWAARSRTWQNSVLLLASYFFYGWWDYRFCGLMLVSSLVDYGLGHFVFNSKTDSRKRLGLTLSVACNLGLLGFFKYFNFFADSLTRFFGEFGWTVHPLIAEIILPVGISFYTFQTLSYTIDIYRGKLEPTRNLIDYLAFVSFFPQLVAGPIERATNLIPQFSVAREFKYDQAVSGCQSILWGFFKKLVVADRLALVVDAAYLDPGSTAGVTLAVATVFFAFQIYCDFSAYSDIAIGTAKLFDINLMQNFNYPYFATSVTEFWRRWHISLSTWFRDYVFIPLGGSRVSLLRTNVNLMITFVLSGLWHGAAWTFIFWGAINGLALVVEKMVNAGFAKSTEQSITKPSRLINLITALATFGLICLSWVFFRASSLSEAFVVIRKILLAPVNEFGIESINAALEFHEQVSNGILVLVIFVGLEWFSRKTTDPLKFTMAWSLPGRWAMYTLVIWLTLHQMQTLEVNPFIYFTF